MKKSPYCKLIILLLPLLVYACKKADNAAANNTNSDYYLKFKFDGVDKSMIKPHGGINLTGAVAGASIYGSFAGDTAKESSILILDSIPINTSKTYKCILVMANGKNAVPQALFNYYDEHNVTYVATYLGYIVGPHPELAINVKFSEITSKNIKGTFHAVLQQYRQKPPYTLHQVTNGEFNLKRDY